MSRGLEPLERGRTPLASLATLAVVAVALGDGRLAGQVGEALRPYETFNACEILGLTCGSVAHYLALLDAREASRTRVRSRFDLALSRNRELGLRPHAARTELAYAQWLSSDRSKRAQARELAASAVATAASCGMHGLLTTAREVARDLSR